MITMTGWIAMGRRYTVSSLAVEDPRPAPSPDRQRRPHRLRWLLVALAALVVLLGALDAGAGWYFSGQILQLDTASYPTTVVDVTGPTVTLSRDDSSRRPIAWGLDWPGGHAILDDRAVVEGDHVRRNVLSVTSGSLVKGQHVALNHDVYDGDPMSALGLPFTPVDVPGPLGRMPAWLVPPSTSGPPDTERVPAKTTWVIAVHGRGGSREEALRALPDLAHSGLTTLVITYRNDTDAPSSPDRHYHLGAAEWQDVEAAVTYARGHGATDVVLFGWSMGGAIVLSTLDRMPAADREHVKAVVLDSPVVDWTSTLTLQARHRHVPGPITWTAERITEQRAGLSFADLDFNRPAFTASLRTPILIFVDLVDTTVPPGPTLRFAAHRPDLISATTTVGGEHTGSWNVDHSRYDRDLGAFLKTRT
jgi:dienelactone hydrolase